MSHNILKVVVMISSSSYAAVAAAAVADGGRFWSNLQNSGVALWPELSTNWTPLELNRSAKDQCLALILPPIGRAR